MKQIITITTDYGDQFASSQLEAVAYSLGFNGKLVQNHDVNSFSIVEGAYAIWQLSKFCSRGTVHVGVVDPGVGSKRKGIIIKTKNFWFIGPDNGLLWPAASRDKILAVWKLNENAFGDVRKTFHGRDIFIKAAAWTSQGKRPEDFGCQKINYKKILHFDFRKGQIVHIDNYGNLKVWGKKTFGLPIFNTFSDVPTGNPLLLNGSSDTLELSINQGSAAKHFRVKLGQTLTKLND